MLHIKKRCLKCTEAMASTWFHIPSHLEGIWRFTNKQTIDCRPPEFDSNERFPHQKRQCFGVFFAQSEIYKNLAVIWEKF